MTSTVEEKLIELNDNADIVSDNIWQMVSKMEKEDEHNNNFHLIVSSICQTSILWQFLILVSSSSRWNSGKGEESWDDEWSELDWIERRKQVKGSSASVVTNPDRSLSHSYLLHQIARPHPNLTCIAKFS